MHIDLGLPDDRDGFVTEYRHSGGWLRHTHAELELNLVTASSAEYLVGDQKAPLHRNTLIWLFPDQDHILVNAAPGFAMWILTIKPAVLQKICTTPETFALTRPRPPAGFYKRLPEDDAQRLCSLLSGLTGMAENGALHNAGLAYAVLSAWASHLSSDDIPTGTDVHPAVEKAARLIRDETDPVGIFELSDAVGLSVSRLSELFKEQVGCTMVEFRNRQRVERFLQLYGKGKRRNVTESALDAGFGSYPQFYRVFREVMGITPARYCAKQKGLR